MMFYSILNMWKFSWKYVYEKNITRKKIQENVLTLITNM